MRMRAALILTVIPALVLPGCTVVEKLDRALQTSGGAGPAGPGEAAYGTGLRHKEGDGTPRDDKKAADQFRKAARRGHADAQFRLGLASHTGRGVPQDYGAAFGWYWRAAEQGHVEARFFVGLFYWRGLGVDKDAAEAVGWFKQAVAKGHAGALYQLGIAYAGGDGVERDPVRAVSRFEIAAAMGHPEAAHLAGMAATNGRGTTKNHAWAARWYGKAAERGLARSQYMLGVAFGAGLGLPKDAAQAYFWLTLAADGDAGQVAELRAATLRDAVRSRLPATERTEIERLATAWRATPAARNPRLGDKPTIRFVQYTLHRSGFAPGPADGLFGAKTRKAIRAYQKKRKLRTTGRLSANLLRRLRSEGQENRS